MTPETEQKLQEIQSRRREIGQEIARLQSEYRELQADENDILMEDYRQRQLDNRGEL